MTDEKKPIGKDATGYEVLRDAVKSLLNQFPGLSSEEEVKFEELGKESGIAFSNDAGALVFAETEDICGMVHQTCQYPFFLVCRTAASAKEKQKMSAAEFLDTFGKWLCGETVMIAGEERRLTSHPKLTQGRKITKISRDNSYGLDPQENSVQDWVLPVTVSYTNEFERW